MDVVLTALVVSEWIFVEHDLIHLSCALFPCLGLLCQLHKHHFVHAEFSSQAYEHSQVCDTCIVHVRGSVSQIGMYHTRVLHLGPHLK